MLMNSKLTTRFFAGVVLLAGSFVLAYIIVAFYSRAQVAPLMGRGISATDFAAPYFFVINRGAMLGLLIAVCTLAYWRLRRLLPTGTAQSSNTRDTFLRFMLLFAPVLVALAAALTLAIYLQQTEGAFSRYDRFLQP